MGIVFSAMVCDEISRLCRVYRGSESSCLTYCNFLKYDKSVIKNYLLLYSNHLKRHWEPGLIRPITKSHRIIKLAQRFYDKFWSSALICYLLIYLVFEPPKLTVNCGALPLTPKIRVEGSSLHQI